MDQEVFFNLAVDKLPNNVSPDAEVYYDEKIVYTSMGIPPCDLAKQSSAVTTKGKFKWVWYWSPLTSNSFMHWFRFFVYLYKDGKFKRSSIFENGIFSYDMGELSWTGFDMFKLIDTLNPGRSSLNLDGANASPAEDDTDSPDPLEEIIDSDSNGDGDINDDIHQMVQSPDDPSQSGASSTITTASFSATNEQQAISNEQGFDTLELYAWDIYHNLESDDLRPKYDYFVGTIDEQGNFHPGRDFGNITDPTVLKYVADAVNERVSELSQESETPTFDFSEWDE